MRRSDRSALRLIEGTHPGSAKVGREATELVEDPVLPAPEPDRHEEPLPLHEPTCYRLDAGPVALRGSDGRHAGRFIGTTP